MTRPLPSVAGRFTTDQVRAAARKGDLGHVPTTRIVAIENTHNASGGRVWPLEDVVAMAETCRELDVSLHLDGARLFNAAVASGVEPSAIAGHADTATICFSKGLGCPFGAILAGPAETIERAWEGKFLFGGALRQSGIAAAAMLYSLDHNVERLADDHAHARRLADGIGIDPATVETNFVPIPDEPGLRERLLERDVGVGGLRPGWLRAVTHLDVGNEEIEQAIERMQEVLSVHV
jgi:threonine aldolase